MSLESDAEFDDSNSAVRPVVFPMFSIPTRLARTVAWALVASAALAVVAGLVTAVSYRRATPTGGLFGGQSLKISLPSVGFADRLSLFSNEAASLTVALLVMVAVVVTAMAVSQDPGDGAAWPALLVATSVIGTIVVLSNVAQAIVILSNATGQFTTQSSGNKASSVLALLPATLSVIAALAYAVNRIRSSPDELLQAED